MPKKRKSRERGTDSLRRLSKALSEKVEVKRATVSRRLKKTTREYITQAFPDAAEPQIDKLLERVPPGAVIAKTGRRRTLERFMLNDATGRWQERSTGHMVKVSTVRRSNAMRTYHSALRMIQTSLDMTYAEAREAWRDMGELQDEVDKYTWSAK